MLRLITNVFESLMSKSTTYGVCDFVHWSVVKTMLPKFRKLEAVTFHDVSFWNEEDAREMGEISGQTSTLEYLVASARARAMSTFTRCSPNCLLRWRVAGSLWASIRRT